MIAVFLPSYPFRGDSAPYLWVFYRLLSDIKEPTLYLIGAEYLENIETLRAKGRNEVTLPAQNHFNYTLPNEETLAKHNFRLLNEAFFPQLLHEAKGNLKLAFKNFLTEEIAELVEEIYNHLSNATEVEAIVSWCNCPSLSAAARRLDIPVIHLEQGPLRSPNYRNTAYLDFRGVNGNTEAEARYFNEVTNLNSNVSIEDLRKFFYRNTDSPLTQKKMGIKVGVPLQVEDDSNLIAYNNGFDNQSLVTQARWLYPNDTPLVRAHPASLFSVNANSLFEIDCSANSIEFLEKCGQVLTVNSSVGLEAMLFEIPVQTLGDSSYSFINKTSDPKERLNRMAFYLFAYLVPFDLIFNIEYLRFRLSKPTLVDIIKWNISSYSMQNATQPHNDSQNTAIDLTLRYALAQDEVEKLQDEVGKLQAAMQLAKLKALDVESNANELASQTRAIEAQLHAMESQLGEKEEEISNLNNEIAELQRNIADKNRELQTILNSKSWRSTAPIRKTAYFMRLAKHSVCELFGSEEKEKRLWKDKKFDSAWYLQQYPDVAQSGIEPYEHYLKFGKAERRIMAPFPKPTKTKHQLKALYAFAQRQGGISGASKKVINTLRNEGFSSVVSKAITLTRQIRSGSGDFSLAPPCNYEEWIERFDLLTETDTRLIREHISSSPLPKMTIVAKLTDTSEEHISQTLHSLHTQLYTSWATFIIVDAPKKEAYSNIGDERIVFLSPDETDKALDKDSAEKCIFLIDGSIILREHALYMFALAIQNGADFAYSDSDVRNSEGRRTTPYFKPNFSPELARQTNYFGNCGALKNNVDSLTLLTKFTSQKTKISDVFQDYLNTGAEQHVTHIPFILFHDRNSILETEISDQKPSLLNDSAAPTVSIIIPTRNHLDFLRPCISSIISKSKYQKNKIEIIVIDNGSTDPDILNYMQQLTAANTIKLLTDPRKFNYAALNNAAANISTGDILIFVNNDVVIDDPQWIRRLVTYAIKEDIGAVGGKLLYPDRTVQHGGIILGIQGVAAHAHLNLGETEPGYHGLNNLSREVASVTGACLAMRKKVFDSIGGFDETLAVAFNDVTLCLDALALGYRNIYLHEPLLIHYESKTRGLDDTPEKAELFRSEAKYARTKHSALMGNDPFYNPNLSLERIYELAVPPRIVKPWNVFRCESSKKLRVLMLSSTHEVGHGVAVVVDLQSRFLAEHGHKVFVGGPRGNNEFQYEGCSRLYLDSPQEAAISAVENDIDCIVAHTPPFFSTFRWTSSEQKTLVYDYGEPNPDFFPDSTARRAVLSEKQFCLTMANRLYAISQSVRDEAENARMGVIRIANSHLAIWEPSCLARRHKVRAELNLEDKIVVLNVCRFHSAERHYKGIDAYAALRKQFISAHPTLTSKMIFALSGKGTKQDISDMEAAGLLVFGNVTDERLIDLYCAADIYVNFSLWEGYNLGIGQALAMGLPVIASDIPAHREFGVFTSDDTKARCTELNRLAQNIDSQETTHDRVATVWDWNEPLSKFAIAIENLVDSK